MNEPPTARAAVMSVPGKDLELREYPIPAVPPGNLLVRVRCCTICRSDLHTWQGRRPSPLPIILGHEIVGVIAELGHGVTHDMADQRLSVGDRITWTMHSSCGRCYYCRDKSLPMKCSHLQKYGHDACDQPPHLRGGFAEYCLLDSGTCVLKLPDALPDLVAAPVNCAVATIVAGWEAAELQPCENVLIQGAGGLGCYAAAFAAHAGCGRVIVTDIDQGRLDFIRRFGATDCINVGQVSAAEAVQQVKQLTRGFGADCALELAGEPAVIPTGLASLRKGGRYVEIGCSFPEAMVTLDVSTILWNRLTIRGVHNYDVRHLQRAVDFLLASQGRYPYREMVTGVFGLPEINEALRSAASRQSIRVALTLD